MKKFFVSVAQVVGITLVVVVLMLGIGALFVMGPLDGPSTPCITDAGTMSFSPTVCEKYW